MWISHVIIILMVLTRLLNGKLLTEQAIQDDLDTFVETIMRCKDIAGLNFVVVSNGDVVVSKGISS